MALPTIEQAVVDGVATNLFIGGEWRDAAGGVTLPVEDPSTGETLAEVADASPADALAALDAADRAQAEWGRTTPRPAPAGRSLHRVWATMNERAEELALLMTLEMGKALRESRSEVIYAAEFLRWFSEEAVRIRGDYMVDPAGKGRILTMRQPVGPCVLVTPWNFPLAMGTRKLGPALAAGCTAVVKPASQTPLSMLALAQIFAEAGLPAGVVNVFTTSHSAATVAPLLSDPRTRKLSFTGSTEVGRALAAQASERLLRVSLELGGNAPFLVFADADLDAAVEGALIAKLRNGGEACTAANRFHVHESLADEFSRRLAERMGALRLGRGSDHSTDIGPLIDGKQRDKVAELVADARDRGARVLTGGAALDGPGYFYEPTVLAAVPPDARALEEEIFGPVAPVASFSDDEEAIAAANLSDYGLTAYMYTRDLSRALRLAERLETGMLGLNQGLVSNVAAPFGGIKQSGLGREGGFEGINEYLQTKYVAVAL